MNAELKPCPWCRESEELGCDTVTEHNTKWWCVTCLACEARGPTATSGEKAVAAWNDRALPDREAIEEAVRGVTYDYPRWITDRLLLLLEGKQ